METPSLPQENTHGINADPCSRAPLFAHLVHRIQNMGAQEMRSAVWGAIHIQNRIEDVVYRPDTDFLQFSVMIAQHPFRYSIAVRWGEVRIGVVVPDEIRGVRGRPDRLRETLDALRPYPADGGDFPWRIVRNLINIGVLVDFVFTSRFAGLTHRVLGEARGVDVLTDALFHEFCHIHHSLLQALTDMNYLISPQGIVDVDDQDVVICHASGLHARSLAEHLKIDPSRVHEKGADEFFVVVPKHGGDRDTLVQRMNDAGFEVKA